MVESLTVKIVGKYAYPFDKCLGQGAFGKVYKGFLKSDHSKIVAIKVIPIILKSEEEANKLKNQLASEIAVMLKLEHENILKLLDIVLTTNNLYIVTEFCQEGSLESRMKSITEEEVLIIIKQITKAMIHLNKMKIVHRDIKPANILIHNSIIKLADFGFSKETDHPEMQKLTTCLGSPYYMAPQVFEGDYSNKCDVWSLGVLFYQMIYQKLPWESKTLAGLIQDLKGKPLNLTHLEKDKEPDEEIKDLLSKMLEKDEEKRLDFTQVLEHAVLKRKIPDKLPIKKN